MSPLSRYQCFYLLSEAPETRALSLRTFVVVVIHRKLALICATTGRHSCFISENYLIILCTAKSCFLWKLWSSSIWFWKWKCFQHFSIHFAILNSLILTMASFQLVYYHKPDRGSASKYHPSRAPACSSFSSLSHMQQLSFSPPSLSSPLFLLPFPQVIPFAPRILESRTFSALLFREVSGNFETNCLFIRHFEGSLNTPTPLSPSRHGGGRHSATRQG